MKKLIFLGAFFLASIFSAQVKSQSQYECRDILTQAFGEYSTAKPVNLTRLGTSPQFGEIRNYSSEGAYVHLERVYKRNSKKSRLEMDRLLKLIGYTGFGDPAFTAAKIVPVTLEKGTLGWMGAYTKDYQYKWSVLARDFRSFKILAKDGPCFLYIMRKCGNAFYIPQKPGEFDCPACPDCPRPSSFLANRDPYCPACEKCPDCKTTTINISGEGKIASGDIMSNSLELPMVAMYGGEKVCLGTYSIPVSSTYEYAVTGSAKYSQTIDVCDNGAGVLPNMDVKLPVNLGFNVSQSQMTLGEGGAMVLNVVDAKRFKTLKKQYGTCSTDMVMSTTEETLMASEVDEMAEMSDNSYTASPGVNGECKKQTLIFNGSKQFSDVNSQNYSNTVSVIGVYKKEGKLVVGESADKYLCLGSYSIPGKTAMVYDLKGESSLTKVMEICNKTGDATPERSINIPVDMDLDISNQKMTVGDAGRVYIPITEKQYKSLGKKFSRCCSDGSKGCF